MEEKRESDKGQIDRDYVLNQPILLRAKWGNVKNQNTYLILPFVTLLL